MTREEMEKALLKSAAIPASAFEGATGASAHEAKMYAASFRRLIIGMQDAVAQMVPLFATVTDAVQAWQKSVYELIERGIVCHIEGNRDSYVAAHMPAVGIAYKAKNSKRRKQRMRGLRKRLCRESMDNVTVLLAYPCSYDVAVAPMNPQEPHMLRATVTIRKTYANG